MAFALKYKTVSSKTNYRQITYVTNNAAPLPRLAIITRTLTSGRRTGYVPLVKTGVNTTYDNQRLRICGVSRPCTHNIVNTTTNTIVSARGAENYDLTSYNNNATKTTTAGWVMPFASESYSQAAVTLVESSGVTNPYNVATSMYSYTEDRRYISSENYWAYNVSFYTSYISRQITSLSFLNKVTYQFGPTNRTSSSYYYNYRHVTGTYVYYHTYVLYTSHAATTTSTNGVWSWV